MSLLLWNFCVRRNTLHCLLASPALTTHHPRPFVVSKTLAWLCFKCHYLLLRLVCCLTGIPHLCHFCFFFLALRTNEGYRFWIVDVNKSKWVVRVINTVQLIIYCSRFFFACIANHYLSLKEKNNQPASKFQAILSASPCLVSLPFFNIRLKNVFFLKLFYFVLFCRLPKFLAQKRQTF